jgi:hypothetical protein
MPGLIREVARTAVIAGTATAVSNRVSRRLASRWAGQEQQQYAQQPQYDEQAPPQAAPAAPAAASEGDETQMLKELGELKTSGVLTDAEFDPQKAKILVG